MVICDRLRELRESKNLISRRHRKENGTLPLLYIPRGEWSLGSRCRDIGEVRSGFGSAALPTLLRWRKASSTPRIS